MERDELSGIIDVEILKKYQTDNPFCKLSDVVYQVIEDAIISCRLKPGSQLNTVRISNLMELSRTPVREALEQLVDTGLVINSPRKKGYYVFDITHSSLEKLINARRAIENYAAFMCAQRSGKLNLKLLRSLAQKFTAAVESGDYSGFAAIDHDFHRLIIDSCGNELLQSMYGSLERIATYTSNRVQERMSVEEKKGANEEVANQHMAIYNAISLGMPDMAFKASDRHLDTTLILCLKRHSFVEATIEE